MAPRTARAKKEETPAATVTENVAIVGKKGRKRNNEEKVSGTENTEVKDASAEAGGKKSKKTVLKPSSENGHKEKGKKPITNGRDIKATNTSKPSKNNDEEVSEREVKSQSAAIDNPNITEIAEKSKPKAKGKKVVQKNIDNEPKLNGVTPAEMPKAKGRQKKSLIEKVTGETSSGPLQQDHLKHDSEIIGKVEKPASRGKAKKNSEEKSSVEKSLVEKNRRRTFIIETNKTEDEVQNYPELSNPKQKGKQQKSAADKTKKTIKQKSDNSTVSKNTDGGKEADDVIAVKEKTKPKNPENQNTTAKARKIKAGSDSQNDTKASTSKVEDSSESKTPSSRKRGSAKPSKEASTKKQKPEKILKNKSATDYESIDFSNSSKDSKGNPWNIKICSWNVDGIRAWVSKGGLDYIKYEKPDILCLQEVKCAQDKLPAEAVSVPGYHAYWLCSDKDGYAGVGIYTTKLAINVQYGLEDEELDAEGRIITAEYEQFYLICTYAPNAGRGLVTLDKKLRWNDVFRRHVNRLNETKPVIICGDMNVAHEEIDLKNPKSNKKNAGFTPEERASMTALLGDGYTDTFRHLYPDRTDAYTFWTYMMGARAKNVGWRLDYVIVSERLAPAVCDSVIRSEVYGSDHCPIALFLHLTGSPKIPSQETP